MAMSVDQNALARLYLADPGTSAVQQIQIENATGGSFTITFDTQTTSAITYPAGAGDVQNALAALTNVGLGNVNVELNAGVPSSLFYVIYFAGDLAAAAQPVVSVNSGSLTGSGASVTVSQLVAGGVTVFSDTELDALYLDGNNNVNMAIALGFDALCSNAAKFNDYVAGQSQEKKSQIFNHLKEMAAWWHEWAVAGQQVQFVRLQGVPPRLTAVPVVSGVPATGLQYGPPFNNPLWGPFSRGRR